MSQPTYLNFTMEILQNWPLVTISDLPNIVSIIYNWFYYNYDKSKIFKNPEGESFSMYFRAREAGNTLPFFISRNFSNGTIGGFSSE